MKSVATMNVIIFATICGISIYRGIDLKKKETWVLSLYSIVTFFLVAFVGTGDFYYSMKIGVIATALLILGGVIEFRNRQRAQNWLQEHSEKRTK